MVVFWSPLDVIVLGAGTRIFGTIDRVKSRRRGAGRVPHAGPADDARSAQYAKLRQVRWRPGMASTGYLGGHVGPDSPAFLRKYVVPLLRVADPPRAVNSPVPGQARPRRADNLMARAAACRPPAGGSAGNHDQVLSPPMPTRRPDDESTRAASREARRGPGPCGPPDRASVLKNWHPRSRNARRSPPSPTETCYPCPSHTTKGRGPPRDSTPPRAAGTIRRDRYRAPGLAPDPRAWPGGRIPDLAGRSVPAQPTSCTADAESTCHEHGTSVHRTTDPAMRPANEPRAPGVARTDEHAPATIASVRGREILDSRGNPTVEVDVILADGTLGRAAVPSGASTGIHEAVELRDGDKTRYLGKGVTKAVANVNARAAPRSSSAATPADQVGLDARPDRRRRHRRTRASSAPTPSSASRLAAAKAAADAARPAALPLPRRRQRPRPARADGQHHQRRQARRQQDRLPGIHGHARRRQDASPRASAWSPRSSTTSRPSSRRPATTPTSATRAASPPTSTTRRPSSSSSTPSTRPATPPAATRTSPSRSTAPAPSCSTRADKKGYKFWKSAPDKLFSSQEMVDLFASWVDKYPIISIEDPLDQDDWAGYAAMTKALGGKVQIVGDDFFVTNTEAPGQRGSPRAAANSILIKVNQIGTLTETLEAVEMAQRSRLHRRDQPPLGRDRGRHHRRHRRGHQLRPDQDRQRQPLRPRSPSTTSSSASRKSWGRPPSSG